MEMDLSTRWEKTDKSVYLVFNHTDVRAKVEFRDLDTNKVIANSTLNPSDSNNILLQAGDNVVYNDTPTREIHVIVNGNNETYRKNILMTGFRCVDNCDGDTIAANIETTPRYWSDKNSWVIPGSTGTGEGGATTA